MSSKMNMEMLNFRLTLEIGRRYGVFWGCPGAVLWIGYVTSKGQTGVPASREALRRGAGAGAGARLPNAA